MYIYAAAIALAVNLLKTWYHVAIFYLSALHPNLTLLFSL